MTRIGRDASAYQPLNRQSGAVRPATVAAAAVVVVIVALAFVAIQSLSRAASQSSRSQLALTVVEKESDELEIVAWRAMANHTPLDADAVAEATQDIARELRMLEIDHHSAQDVEGLRSVMRVYGEGLQRESALLADGRLMAARRHHNTYSVPHHQTVDALLDVMHAEEAEHVLRANRTVELGVLGVLGAAVLALIGLFVRMLRDREAMGRVRERELAAQALSDPLTGLANRRALTARLTDAFARQQSMTMALIDLDRFKAYNDTFGHGAGDQLLRRLAGELSVAAGPDGLACRLGGDEFCVVVPVADHTRVHEAVLAFEEQTDDCTVRASFGSVTVPEEASNATSALALADQRMYRHKADRRIGPRGPR